MNNDDNVCDGLDSHATYVGSVILDCLGNASRKADLRIAKVLENGRGSSYDAYTAILDLADRHVQLINCSWGGKTDNKMLAFAMKYAAEHNSIVVCSSGNDGGAVAYPAKYSDTIAVSACDSDGKIADFSNTGSEITYCAPGVDIVVDGVENSRRIVPGTSFSAQYGSEGNLKYSWVTNIAANTFEERIPDDIKVNLVYYIKIVAVDAGGRTIAESEPVKSARYLLTIENLTASVKSDAVYISFDALANVDGYDVNLKNAKTGEYISFNHSDYNGYKFNRSELQPGDYTVSVFARYNSGEGPESSVGWSSSTTFVIK